jgi:hypothetical protein
MVAARRKTGLVGAQLDDLESGSDVIARASNPRHTSPQR